MKPRYLAATALAIGLSMRAEADGLGDWSLDPYTADFSDYTLSVGGTAYGSLFSANAPEGSDKPWATGAATLTADIKRDFDSGMMVGLKSAFEIAHDRYSGDNYGSDLVQKVYGVVQTGLGRAEIGMTDGAGYALAVTGPVVDDATSLDNPNATFFRDPTTNRAFPDIFTLNSAVEPTFNYAKISYYTPRLFGLQFGASYTPSQGKDVIPFLNGGPKVPDRPHSMWESALSYSDSFGPLSLGLYAGLALGHDAAPTPGHAGLTDWGLGGEADYNIDDDMKLSFGGAYRQSNAYAFDVDDVLAHHETNSAHLSTTLTDGAWIIGGEYGDGTAEGSPKLGVRGYEASAGYVFNANMQATLGWQELHYSRDAGIFYTGLPRAAMDAVFVHLKLHV
jgi:hypothetical protein